MLRDVLTYVAPGFDAASYDDTGILAGVQFQVHQDSECIDGVWWIEILAPAITDGF